MLDGGITWDHTTWLNIAFLALAAFLVIVFVRSGSRPMLRMMGGSPDAGHAHEGHGHAAQESAGQQHHH